MDQRRNWLAGLSQIDGISHQEYKKIITGELQYRDLPESVLNAHGKAFINSVGFRSIFLGESDYPYLLSEISDPPRVLFYEGDLTRIDFLKAVSVVGTRTPSDYGSNFAKNLSYRLQKIGVNIVSGLAQGIDRIAQTSAMEAGGVTIGVLGESIDIWKSQNVNFYKKYKSNLILLSEYLPGTHGQSFTYPQRNRIIAGLTHKTIIVEAPARSGALITADFANQYDRSVYALPHEFFSLKGKGNNELIKSNKAIIFTDFVDIFEDMFMGVPSIQLTNKLDARFKGIIDILESKNLSADEIAVKLNQNLPQVVANLTKLETIGILTRLIDGRYKIS